MVFLLTSLPVQAATVPSNLLYEGRILDGSRNPVTSAIVLRFSLWKSTDWTADDASGSIINIAATNYGGWYEVQTITPSSNGIMSVQIGSGTALPTIDFAQHKYLQVEVKSVGEADTSYQLLDPTGDEGVDTVDRRFIGSVAYAKNAESVQNRTVGTSSGNIVLFGSGGTINVTTLTFGNDLLPQILKFSGTNNRFEFSKDVSISGTLAITGALAVQSSFTASGAIQTESNITINKDNAAQDAVLTFGNVLLPETLTFSHTNNQFEFSDDVSITGNLGISGTTSGATIHAQGLLTASGSAVFGGSARFNSTMTMNGVTYTFPTSQAFSGSVLSTNGAGQLSWSRPFTFTRKTADESVTSSTTLQNDDHLFFSVGANEVWVFEIYAVGQAKKGKDFRFAVTAPAGSTCLISASEWINLTSSRSGTCGTAITGISGNDTDQPYLITGYVSTDDTAGTVQLQWAQNETEPTASILRQNTYLVAHRVQ